MLDYPRANLGNFAQMLCVEHLNGQCGTADIAVGAENFERAAERFRHGRDPRCHLVDRVLAPVDSFFTVRAQLE